MQGLIEGDPPLKKGGSGISEPPSTNKEVCPGIGIGPSMLPELGAISRFLGREDESESRWHIELISAAASCKGVREGK